MVTTETIPFDNYGIREMVCIIQERNRKRFYRIEVAPGLFGPLIIRAWGRIGCKVRVIVDNFGSLVDALNEANRLYHSKKKKGYSDVGSIVEGKVPVSPKRVGNIRIRRVGEGEPTLPGLDLSSWP